MNNPIAAPPTVPYTTSLHLLQTLVQALAAIEIQHHGLKLVRPPLARILQEARKQKYKGPGQKDMVTLVRHLQDVYQYHGPKVAFLVSDYRDWEIQ